MKRLQADQKCSARHTPGQQLDDLVWQDLCRGFEASKNDSASDRTAECWTVAPSGITSALRQLEEGADEFAAADRATDASVSSRGHCASRISTTPSRD